MVCDNCDRSQASSYLCLNRGLSVFPVHQSRRETWLEIWFELTQLHSLPEVLDCLLDSSLKLRQGSEVSRIAQRSGPQEQPRLA